MSNPGELETLPQQYKLTLPSIKRTHREAIGNIERPGTVPRTVDPLLLRHAVCPLKNYTRH